MPAFLQAIVQSLLAAGLFEAARRVYDEWTRSGDADAAARAATLPTVPQQAPTVGRRHDDFDDDPLAEECRWDRFLRSCEE